MTLILILVAIIIILAVALFVVRWQMRKRIEAKMKDLVSMDMNDLNDERVREKLEKIKRVLEMATGKGEVSNKDIESMLGVSDSSATRYLDQLEKQNKLEQVGKSGPAVTYKIKE